MNCIKYFCIKYIQRGKLDVVADDGREIYVTLGEGAVFGEVSCCRCCR